MMRYLWVGVSILFLAGACVALDDKQGGSSAENVSKVEAGWVSDTVYAYKSGEWELRIEYLQKGSRSEGQDGKLLKGGKAVDPQQSGREIETSLGKIKYYGSERRRAWDLTGWNFADRRRAKISSLLPKKTDK